MGLVLGRLTPQSPLLGGVLLGGEIFPIKNAYDKKVIFSAFGRVPYMGGGHIGGVIRGGEGSGCCFCVIFLLF